MRILLRDRPSLPRDEARLLMDEIHSTEGRDSDHWRMGPADIGMGPRLLGDEAPSMKR